MWNHLSKPQISSVHTTINVLEGIAEYKKQGYSYRIKDIENAMKRGITVLLDRKLFQVKNTSSPIHPSMAQHHFPSRWKYDYLRILEFLANQRYPYCDEIKPTLELLKNHLRRGKLTKGTTISGLTHISLEKESFGRFNTFRAYIVLKHYNPSLAED